MATINGDMLTLADHAHRLDPDGKVAVVVDLMSKRSPAIRDAIFLEGNLPTGHRVTARTGLPSIYFRRYNEGFRPSKDRVDQFDEVCGMLTGRSQVDKDLAELEGVKAARASVDRGFIMSFTQGAEFGLFYESTAAGPERFTGLTPRLDSFSGPFKEQIVACDPNASGNNNTSLWFITWGPDTTFGIFPKGSKVGLSSDDRGVIDVPGLDNRPVPSYVTDWRWKLGFCVKDARYNVRLCNIDLSKIQANDDTLVPGMIRAYERIESHGVGRTVIYCTREVRTYLWLQARNFAKGVLSADMVEGKPVLSFMGIPIEITDGLKANEATVV